MVDEGDVDVYVGIWIVVMFVIKLLIVWFGVVQFKGLVLGYGVQCFVVGVVVLVVFVVYYGFGYQYLVWLLWVGFVQYQFGFGIVLGGGDVWQYLYLLVVVDFQQ